MTEYMWGKHRLRQGLGAMALGAAASACALAEDGPIGGDEEAGLQPGASVESDLAESLLEGVPLEVAGTDGRADGSFLQMEASRAEGDFGTQSLRSLELEVLGGYVDARSYADEDDVVIGELAIDVGEVELPTDLISDDVVFSGIRAHMAGPQTLEPEWLGGGERAEATAELDFVVEWGVTVGDADFYPLAPVDVRDIEVVFELYRDEGGEVRAEIGGFRDGVFYEWGGLVELGGLSLDLRAREEG